MTSYYTGVCFYIARKTTLIQLGCTNVEADRLFGLPSESEDIVSEQSANIHIHTPDTSISLESGPVLTTCMHAAAGRGSLVQHRRYSADILLHASLRLLRDRHNGELLFGRRTRY